MVEGHVSQDVGVQVPPSALDEEAASDRGFFLFNALASTAAFVDARAWLLISAGQDRVGHAAVGKYQHFCFSREAGLCLL